MFEDVTEDVFINWLKNKAKNKEGIRYSLNAECMVVFSYCKIIDINVNAINNIEIMENESKYEPPIITINCNCKPIILYSKKLDLFTIRYNDTVMTISSLY